MPLKCLFHHKGSGLYFTRRIQSESPYISPQENRFCISLKKDEFDSISSLAEMPKSLHEGQVGFKVGVGWGKKGQDEKGRQGGLVQYRALVIILCRLQIHIHYLSS